MAVDEKANAGRTKFQKARRKFVKRNGRRVLGRLNVLYASQSTVPALPVLPNELFDWLPGLEAGWEAIRREAEAVLRLEEHLPRFYDVAPDQKRISSDDKWLSFALRGFGIRGENAAAMCPETSRALDAIPGVETALFSIMQPGAQVPPHIGITRGVLRCHLGLLVPKNRHDCVIYVDGAPHCWEEGRAFVFDDTFTHSVRNDTDEHRVVLMIDFERPMRPLGRTLHRFALRMMRRTAVVKDAQRLHAEWEKGFLAATR